MKFGESRIACGWVQRKVVGFGHTLIGYRTAEIPGMEEHNIKIVIMDEGR